MCRYIDDETKYGKHLHRVSEVSVTFSPLAGLDNIDTTRGSDCMSTSPTGPRPLTSAVREPLPAVQDGVRRGGDRVCSESCWSTVTGTESAE